MDLLDDFKIRIDAFLERTGMAPSRFGQASCGDPNFVSDLRVGREPRLATIRKVDAFMDAYRVPGSGVSEISERARP